MKKRNLWALDIGLPGWHQVCLIASLPLDQEHQLPRWICGPNDSFCLPQTWSILFAGKIYEATCRPRSKPLGLISSPGWAFLAAGSSFELGPGRFLFSCSVHQIENYNRCKTQPALSSVWVCPQKLWSVLDSQGFLAAPMCSPLDQSPSRRGSTPPGILDKGGVHRQQFTFPLRTLLSRILSTTNSSPSSAMFGNLAICRT